MNHWPQLSTALESGRELTVLSHGAGVQTTTLCWMVARGDLPPIDAAVFADTGGEPRRVYEYLDWMEPQLPFPLIRVKRPGPSLEDLSIGVANGTLPREGAPLPPWFFYNADEGREGMMRKHCSGEFKREVVIRELRRQLGLAKGERSKAARVELWIGMTTDEMFRVAPARQKFLHHRHPLVELNLTRTDCIKWLQERQLPVPPKSACVFCPYRTNAQWRHMATEAPDDFAEAIRATHPRGAFVHRSLEPLRRANLLDHHVDQLGLPLGADCDSCGL
jgi:hypothetical protein